MMPSHSSSSNSHAKSELAYATAQQKSPSVDCDLASYRIRWSNEVEQYFVAKHKDSSGAIVRKTAPLADKHDNDDRERYGQQPSGTIKGLRSSLAKTRI
jgi:hypothetical protein